MLEGCATCQIIIRGMLDLSLLLPCLLSVGSYGRQPILIFCRSVVLSKYSRLEFDLVSTDLCNLEHLFFVQLQAQFLSYLLESGFDSIFQFRVLTVFV